MDANSWSVYEKNPDRSICKRSHLKELIQSLIASKASKTEAIEAKKSVDDFAKLCALRDENADFRADEQRVGTEKNKLVKIERNLEEEKRKKMEAEKRKKDKAKRFQDKRSEMEKEHAKLCKSREEAEREIEIQEDRYKTTRNEIKLLQKELSKKEGGWIDVIGTALLRERSDEENIPETGLSNRWSNVIIQTLTVVTVVNGFVLNGLKIREIWIQSDQRLKQNVITLPHSEYSIIGITAVCWKWNAIAEKTFGFKGNASGVIAQEVQTLYPWLVTEGYDGYLRVRFDGLQDMINEALTYNRNAAYPMCLTGRP